MIDGNVRSGEAVVSLVLAGPERHLEVSATIDTGFGGMLILPEDLMSEFGQGYIEFTNAILADGSTLVKRSMFVDFYFQGGLTRLYRERALELGHQPLIGMRLLEGYRLSMDVTEGGSVALEPLGPAP